MFLGVVINLTGYPTKKIPFEEVLLLWKGSFFWKRLSKSNVRVKTWIHGFPFSQKIEVMCVGQNPKGEPSVPDS